MRLFGAIEYLIITIGADSSLHGVRLRGGRQLTVLRAVELPPGTGSPAERIKELLGRLERRREQIVLLAAALPGSALFRCRTPLLPARELASALEFEVPQQVLRLPAAWRMQFVSEPAGTEELDATVQITPQEEFDKLCELLEKLHLPADEYLPPFLTLPVLPSGSRVYLPAFEPDFYWMDGSFHPYREGIECNRELIDLLRKEIRFADGSGEPAYRKFLPELLIGRFAAAPDFARHRAGVEILPKALRPQRLRSQLRLAVLLGILLLLLAGWNGLGSVLAFHTEYSAITARTRSARQKTAEIQRKLRSRDREYKEMSRILDLNVGDREMTVTLGRLSSALPSSVLVSNFRLTDTGVEMTLQTTQEDLDLGAALRKAPGFKVATLQNRRVNDTLTMITLKLNRIQEAGK